MPLAHVLAASLLLAATSTASRFIVWLPSRRRVAWLPWLQAIAVGLLVGDSLMHVLPEALESAHALPEVMMTVAAGTGFLVAVETLVRASDASHPSVAAFARMTLIGDVIHHLIDGLILAAAFSAGLTEGYLALVAIAIHEVPREMGSAAVLVAAGYDPRRAFVLSVGMAAAVPCGVLMMNLLSPTPATAAFAAAFAAGTILYVALADILPSLWQRTRGVTQFSTLVGMTAGLLFMFVLAQGEHT